MKGLRRAEDFEDQILRSVPWNRDSWRNRVKEYLEKKRSSKEVNRESLSNFEIYLQNQICKTDQIQNQLKITLLGRF